MLKIKGLEKSSLIDYPNELACTVFIGGCNFRCPFCYSSELVIPEKLEKQPEIDKKEFFDFLKKREGLLTGVVICGGEPTIHSDLKDFIKEIKEKGYKVKLDTNGSNPKMIQKLIEKDLVDYIAMDVKAPKEKYNKVAGVEVDINKIEKSINLLKKSGIDHEFRTTLVPSLLDKEDIIKIGKWIGEGKYYIQKFRGEKTLDPEFEKVEGYTPEEIGKIKKAVSPFVDECQIRG